MVTVKFILAAETEEEYEGWAAALAEETGTAFAAVRKRPVCSCSLHFRRRRAVRASAPQDSALARPSCTGGLGLGRGRSERECGQPGRLTAAGRRSEGQGGGGEAAGCGGSRPLWPPHVDDGFQ